MSEGALWAAVWLEALTQAPHQPPPASEHYLRGVFAARRTRLDRLTATVVAGSVAEDAFLAELDAERRILQSELVVVRAMMLRESKEALSEIFQAAA